MNPGDTDPTARDLEARIAEVVRDCRDGLRGQELYLYDLAHALVSCIETDPIFDQAHTGATLIGEPPVVTQWGGYVAAEWIGRAVQSAAQLTAWLVAHGYEPAAGQAEEVTP